MSSTLTGNNRTFVSFSLDEQLFGIDILLVREINKQLDINPVPKAPEHIRGLINLRGQIVTVLDLKNRISQGTCDLGTFTHNIIIKSEAELSILRAREQLDDLVSGTDNVGLLVDNIGEVVTVTEEEIEPPPANIGNMDGQFFTGVVKLDNQLMAVLNVKRVLDN